MEDDAGSDGEVERLSNIIEEEEVVDRWVRRRSNASLASVNGAIHSYDICDLWYQVTVIKLENVMAMGVL